MDNFNLKYKSYVPFEKEIKKIKIETGVKEFYLNLKKSSKESKEIIFVLMLAAIKYNKYLRYKDNTLGAFMLWKSH